MNREQARIDAILALEISEAPPIWRKPPKRVTTIRFAGLLLPRIAPADAHTMRA